jgi:hypothetical protein
MYRNIYCYFYSIAKKKNPEPDFYSAGIVFIAQLIHFMTILMIIKVVFGLKFTALFSNNYGLNKLLMMPLGLIWLFLLHFYFKRKIKKYEELLNTSKSSIIKTLGYLIIIFTPLILSIYLSKL